jgi:L-seryl-tRNA(Ser) seleniumtransferase
MNETSPVLFDRDAGRPSAQPFSWPFPSVDVLLKRPEAVSLIETHGRPAVLEAVRRLLADIRQSWASSDAARSHPAEAFSSQALLARCAAELAQAARPSLRPVFNLTGVVLHTNLGRALLPRCAIDAAAAAMASPVNLEFDLDSGGRGERDDHVEALLRKLTGAEAATVVNNNAAAVLLVLNSLALRRDVVVSRGELVEIGGSFRIPEIMARAGCRLREVGATNRTHERDFADAIGPRTALIMKVHTSNYVIQGFAKAVPAKALAALAKSHGVGFVEDLGSGTLTDLERFGLPHEPTAQESLAAGADLVTFSGDKLLGGPQAGVIVGRRDLIALINRNPLKRALRLDKVRLAALEAVLRLYENPERLAAELPTLRSLTRSVADIRAMAEQLRPALAEALDGYAQAETTVIECRSQIGSGALPLASVESAGLAISVPAAAGGRRKSGSAVMRLAAAFRQLPTPVVGRIEDDDLLFDLRCLEDKQAFRAQLGQLALI